MNLDQLETFVQVARVRSFSRAAISLDLAQPTISGRVGSLESELGTTLFVRHGHTLDLSDAGRALLPYAERILALRSEGRQEVRRVVAGGLGRLALGANPTCSQYLVPRLVERFHALHPDVPIWIRTALSPQVMDGLADGTTAVALCSRAQLHPRAEVLWGHEDPLVLVAAPTHPLGRKGICTRAELAECTILSTQAGPTRLGLRHLLPPDTEDRVIIEATAGEVMTQLVRRGLGVTVLPSLAIWEELARGELVAVTVRDGALPPYEVALVRWGGRSLPPAALTFVDLVRATQVADLLAS